MFINLFPKNNRDFKKDVREGFFNSEYVVAV